jgi:hypothetical protein
VLIHGKDYINAYVYAYSVDDAVEIWQVAGDGLILAIGGVNGLPNPNHATPYYQCEFWICGNRSRQVYECTIVPT